MNDQRQKEINARLLQLSNANGGTLTADIVITDARDPSSPLHGEFQWDPQQAAQAHWVSVASRLINSYRVVVSVGHVTLNAPVFVRSPEQPKQYVRSDRLANESALATAALRREAARVQAAIDRMKALAAVLGMAHRIPPLEASVKALLEAME